MTELTGTLEGVGLPAVVRFLSGLSMTGCLRIKHDSWRGELFFESGRIVSASFGSRRGLTAIDALVQALPAGSFTFDSEALPPSSERNVALGPAELQAHLDELGARTASGEARLPSLDTIPHLVNAEDDAEEPLPLDRGMVQTLLAVDGHHTIREIVSRRGTLDVLWHLSSLVDMGLVRLEGAEHGRRARGPVTEPARGRVAEPARGRVIQPPRAPAAEAVDAASASRALPDEPASAEPASVRSPASTRLPASARAAEPAGATEPAGASAEHTQRCPKLGFEDDPRTSYARPTRLHRCFAGPWPMPLSVDQQRELCLTGEYPTCPRLTGESTAAAEDPRIVRVAFGNRYQPRTPPAATPSTRTAAQPARVRAFVQRDATAAAREPEPAPAPGVPQPTPMRARVQRNPDPMMAGFAQPGAPADAAPRREQPLPAAGPAVVTPPAPERPSPAPAPSVTPGTRSGSRMRLVLAAVSTLAVLALVAIGFFLVHVNFGDSSPAADDGLDPTQLPNASAVAAGTPLAALPGVNARATAVPAQAPTSIAAPAAEPTAAPTAAPTAPPTTAPTVAAPAGQPVLLDESFADNARNWPNNPQGTAWVAGGAYHIATRRATQFVAIDAPVPSVQQIQDVVVNATFHKVDGPPGGGYGIIVRNQAPGSLDGVNQNGRYYVVEAGDKGDIGMWRRDTDHWVDLLPWQHSDAVRPDTAVNQLTVRAIGDQLSLLVNGAQVATRTDSALHGGGVGVFVGGDGNQVSLDHLSVQTP